MCAGPGEPTGLGASGVSMHRPRIGSYAVYEPTEEGWDNWAQDLAQLNGMMALAGLEVVAASEAVKDSASCRRVAEFFAGQHVEMLHALIASWSFDHYSL